MTLLVVVLVHSWTICAKHQSMVHGRCCVQQVAQEGQWAGLCEDDDDVDDDDDDHHHDDADEDDGDGVQLS